MAGVETVVCCGEASVGPAGAWVGCDVATVGEVGVARGGADSVGVARTGVELSASVGSGVGVSRGGGVD
jgi:hypothetical protein